MTECNEPGRVLLHIRRQEWMLCNLLVIACCIVFIIHAPLISARALISDDHQYLTRNYLVRNPGWTSAWQFLSEVFEPSTVRGYYQPLTMISLMLDCATGGSPDHLRPFHRTNLLLHIINTGLLVLLLHSLFHRPWSAACTGLLFGLHPLVVEPVAWIAQRKTLLAATFALCALIAFVNFTRTRRMRYLIVCTVAYLFSVMSKPTALPLPGLILLLDFWPLRRTGLHVVLEKIGLFGIAGAAATVAFLSQSNTANLKLMNGSLVGPVLIEPCYRILFYLGKIAWPARLSPYYCFSSISSSGMDEATMLIGAGCLILLVVLSLRWRRPVCTCVIAFLLMLLPTLGAVQFTNVSVGDRYVYLPSVGLLILLSFLLTEFVQHCRKLRSTIALPALVLLVILVGGGECVSAARYAALWRDTLSIHEHMAVLCPGAASVHNNLGIELGAVGRFDEAIAHFHQALQIEPNTPLAAVGLGDVLLARGDLEGAMRYYKQASLVDPEYPEAHYRLSVGLNAQGRLSLALEELRKAISLSGHPPWYYLNDLAFILATSSEASEPKQSLQYAQQAYALTTTPSQRASVLATWGAALAAKGDSLQAKNKAEEAITLAYESGDLELTERIREHLDAFHSGEPLSRVSRQKRMTPASEGTRQ